MLRIALVYLPSGKNGVNKNKKKKVELSEFDLFAIKSRSKD